MLIKLTNSHRTATVDLEDYFRVRLYSWTLNDDNGRYTISMTGGTRISLGKFILNLPQDRNIITDHVDRNPFNFKRDNLRPATYLQNAFNRKKQSKNRSGYKGVSWDLKSKKWRAQIQHCYNKFHLGFFNSKEEAAKRYNEAAIGYFGEFAVLNEITEEN